MAFATIGVSPDFHKVIKQIAANEPDKKMYEVCDDVLLPHARRYLERQLQKKPTKKGKHHVRRTTKT